MVRIIAEIGSTHNNKLEYCKEAIDRCLDMGVDAIKFQLFPKEKKYLESGNIWLDPETYLEAADYARQNLLDCSASVFDEDSFDFLMRTYPPFIKFSYSKKDEIAWIQEAIENTEVIVSCDIMTDRSIPNGVTKLFCLPFYPVYYKVQFDHLFPRFDGFSDHTLGYDQTLEAVTMGAKIIEKHMKLDHSDIICPDSYFALAPHEMKHMVTLIRQSERAQ